MDSLLLHGVIKNWSVLDTDILVVSSYNANHNYTSQVSVLSSTLMLFFPFLNRSFTDIANLANEQPTKRVWKYQGLVRSQSTVQKTVFC